jgi:hypothetical protein
MKIESPKIEIVECISDNNSLGMPDHGLPEEALQDFINYKSESEASIAKGENDFIIWKGETDSQYFANAWMINPKNGEKEYLAYYEFKVAS